MHDSASVFHWPSPTGTLLLEDRLELVERVHADMAPRCYIDVLWPSSRIVQRLSSRGKDFVLGAS